LFETDSVAFEHVGANKRLVSKEKTKTDIIASSVIKHLVIIKDWQQRHLCLYFETVAQLGTNNSYLRNISKEKMCRLHTKMSLFSWGFWCCFGAP